jgi:hypothetical protein
MALNTTLYASSAAMWQDDNKNYKNPADDQVQAGKGSTSGTTYRSALAFNLSGFSSTTKISVARLMVYAYDDQATNTPVLYAYRITSNWSTNNVSWNTEPSHSQTLGNQTLTSSFRGNTNLTLNTGYVENWITGAWSNQGLKIRMSGENADRIYFRGRTYATTAQRPKLYLEYYDKPVISTSGSSEIGSKKATLTGNITSVNGENCTVRGFQYGLSQTPTWTINQSGSYGTGAFSLTPDDLTPGKEYYFRAYATNPAGTSYGSWLSFKTKVAAGAFLSLI